MSYLFVLNIINLHRQCLLFSYEVIYVLIIQKGQSKNVSKYTVLYLFSLSLFFIKGEEKRERLENFLTFYDWPKLHIALKFSILNLEIYPVYEISNTNISHQILVYTAVNSLVFNIYFKYFWYTKINPMQIWYEQFDLNCNFLLKNRFF